MTRERSGADTVARTKRSVTPAREPTLRERKTRPEPVKRLGAHPHSAGAGASGKP
ncbi:hypothetical protein FOC60_00695 [Rothia dentocariosa]|uniref:hypothetical protein n=1 Tax=Rothia dentocariosa TaxID=2047 RepID=UPI0015609DA6|nr:hypothetical protein [Rothia dentocariosa]QKI08495.1 hypothetical protein FOC60_00695 [Rothia dentocariosa]